MIKMLMLLMILPGRICASQGGIGMGQCESVCLQIAEFVQIHVSVYIPFLKNSNCGNQCLRMRFHIYMVCSSQRYFAYALKKVSRFRRYTTATELTRKQGKLVSGIQFLPAVTSYLFVNTTGNLKIIHIRSVDMNMKNDQGNRYKIFRRRRTLSRKTLHTNSSFEGIYFWLEMQQIQAFLCIWYVIRSDSNFMEFY